MSLSKKTKTELLRMAEELELELDSKLKKPEVLDAVKEYFISNADDFDENHKLYEYVRLVNLGSPKKNSFEIVDSEEGEEENPVEEIIEESEDSYSVDDYDSDEDPDYELAYTLSDAFRTKRWGEYFEIKQLELRDYLSDPYSLNELSFIIEASVLFASITQWTTAGSYVYACCVEKPVISTLMPLLNSIPVIDIKSLNLQNVAIAHIFLLFSYAIPNLISNFINFTYDFSQDAFTFALSKLFFAIVLFKSEISVPNVILQDVKYHFSALLDGPNTLAVLKHTATVATFELREIFGNWIIIGAIFTSILAFYANLSFI